MYLDRYIDKVRMGHVKYVAHTYNHRGVEQRES